jgi:lipid-binding SYLF domain-containing protein
MYKSQLKARAVIWFVLVALAYFLTPFSSRSAAVSTEEEKRVEEAIVVLREIVSVPEEGLPEALLRNAHGIAIIPGVIKGAYGIGGQYGKGVLLVQESWGWSNPSFITLAGGSFGWQIGLQKSDVVLVFKSRKSIEDIAEGKITLGADASVTAGPVGRGAEASTDLDLEAEIYSYSKSKGLFAGVALKGGVIQIDGKANEAFYGDRSITAGTIFTDPDLKTPSAAEKLKKELAQYTRTKT